MNYLETGLSHTALYPKKTQFSPPRFIPLCNLGRKYLGLEPLTRREYEELINRLSEPKRPAGDNEEQSLLQAQARPMTSASNGRFVGQKRMSALQIEKMVKRLYSRRSLKESTCDDDSVSGDDVINVTENSDDCSDSDADGGEQNEDSDQKEAKDRTNSQLRRQSSSMTRCESDTGCLYKRDVMGGSVLKKDQTKTSVSKAVGDNLTPDVPRLKLDMRPRFSLGSARDTSLLEKRMKYRDGPDRNVKRSNTVCSYIVIKPEMKRTQSCPSYAYMRMNSAKMPKADRNENKQCTDSGCSLASARSNRSEEPEISRPQPSKATTVKDGVKFVKYESTRATKVVPSYNQDTKVETPRSARKSETKIETNTSPRQKLFKSEDNKHPRFAVSNCDELLIDRVATYNRSPRVRGK